MVGYATAMRSSTKGAATFHMSFSHFAPAQQRGWAGACLNPQQQVRSVKRLSRSVPLWEDGRVHLRSSTKGTASVHMSFSHFAPAQ